MISRLFLKLRRDRRGTVALITAIVMFPLLFLAIGVPIDMARAIQARSILQNFSDSAAIAGEVDIANGATANQACTLAYTMGASLIFSPSSGLSNFGETVSTSPGVSCNPKAQITTATAPNTVVVTGSYTLPTTFTSFLKSAIPVAASATAMGPQGFITICITPTASFSSDINQAYYYFRNPDGSLVNQDGSVINPADYPGLNTGPTSSVPTLNSGVALSAFLTDNKYPTANGPVAPSGYCDAAHTQVAVTIKNGLGQRLGFEFVNVTGGQFPCYYGAHTTAMNCLTTNTNYLYDPTSSSTALTGGNANGFQNYFLAYGTPTTWTTNAYGSFIGEENFMFSTDFPNTYATNNFNISILSPKKTDPLFISPRAVNSCFEVTPALGVLSPTFNGYSSQSQGCLLSQTPANAVAQSYGASSAATVTFGFGNGGATSTLVCLAKDGASRMAGTTYTPATAVSGGATYVTGTTSLTGVQQENMIIANNSTTNGSLGGNIYQCPINNIGNPYYPDPTCAELKGATLSVGWNDMGGFESDNGTSPSDLSYTYSCQPPTPGALTVTALTQ